MNLPEIDVAALKKWKKQNFKERLAFLDKYAEWVKKNSNKDWNKQQQMIIGMNRH